MNNKTRRACFLLIAGLALLVLAFAIALHVATRTLKSRIEQALGPESEVADIVVHWSSIELRGLHVRAPKGWPVPDALRAERIVVTPDLLGLISARVHVPHITIEQAYVSALRTADGRFRLLPGLLERREEKSDTPLPATEVSIGTIELRDGVLEFFDASVRRPAHKTRLEQLHAVVEHLHVPHLTGRTEIALDGVVKGVRHNGQLSLQGWAELAGRNSEVTTRLREVDLVALQPYLIKASETGVRRGVLDLRMKSKVQGNRLHAPGTVTLSGLELAPGKSMFGTFMGMPRQAAIAALKNRDGQITVDFMLEGDLSDPRFSLNENMALRIGAAVAETLGISIEGLTRGIGSAAEGLGGMVKKLFGQ